MNRTTLLLTTTIALLWQIQPFAQLDGASATDHLGTWQLVSSKYGDAKGFSDVPKDERHVKIITATHFLWVSYDDKNRVITTSMGGSCSLHGGKYTEVVEFFLPKGMRTYLGKKQEFTVRVEGDKLYQSGKLSDGMQIEEVWQRVKPAQD
jgi:hypothetical protein